MNRFVARKDYGRTFTSYTFELVGDCASETDRAKLAAWLRQQNKAGHLGALELQGHLQNIEDGFAGLYSSGCCGVAAHSFAERAIQEMPSWTRERLGIE